MVTEDRTDERGGERHEDGLNGPSPVATPRYRRTHTHSGGDRGMNIDRSREGHAIFMPFSIKHISIRAAELSSPTN